MYKGNGKLLLSGEYFVLNGALALALPTRLGQSFNVKEQSRGYDLTWKSYDHSKNLWFEAKYSLYNFKCIQTSDEKISKSLGKLLKACCQQNSEFLSTWKGYQVKSELEYPLEWGLGSSSTLIHFLAEWSDINAYALLFDTLGGSGYDLACARADGPLLYRLSEESISIDEIGKDLPGSKHMYFVYSGQSQDTSSEVKKHQSKKAPKKNELDRVSELSELLTQKSSYADLIEIIQEHEGILSQHLGRPTVKAEKFSDFWGEVKSLGAWGGDFYLAVSNKGKKETQEYFAQKGLDTFFDYSELIL